MKTRSRSPVAPGRTLFRWRSAAALLVLGAALGGGSLIGCGSAATVASSGGACDPGAVQTCPCTVITTGTQVCNAAGTSWGVCSCSDTGADAGMDSGPGAGVCGDGTCNSNESCQDCPADCGECPACNLAPSCTGASAVPANPTALPSFDNAGQTSYTSGAGFGDPSASLLCSDPLLKMRLSQIVIHKNGDPGKLNMFCMVQADDGQSSQLVLTSEYMNLSDNNPAIVLLPSAGTFWGEAVNGVKLSQFNVTITYQCYMVLQEGALEKALNAVAGYAGSIAGIPGNPYGWAFGLGGAAAAAAAAAAASGSGATPLLNVQQTIGTDSFIKLTNGYTWTIEQSGSTKADGDCNVFGSCDWDWELDVEAWGCAAPKGQQPM